jgi:hypothetical protein
MITGDQAAIIVVSVLVLLFVWAKFNLLIGLVDLVRRLRKGQGSVVVIFCGSPIVRAGLLMLILALIAIAVAMM